MTELHKPHVRPAGDRGMNTSCLLAPFNKQLWREQPSYRGKKKKKAWERRDFFPITGLPARATLWDITDDSMDEIISYEKKSHGLCGRSLWRNRLWVVSCRPER